MARAQPDSSPRRSALLQTRSRDTRRKLIRTALEIWNEHGFDQAFEETTAEQIAKAAGVSKGTFYFHFAHKEDILLELPWATAQIMIEEAEASIERGEPTAELLEQLMTSLARRVTRAPRAAVLRVTTHWSRRTQGMQEEPRGFGAAFHMAFAYAVERGELPAGVDVDDLAYLLQAATMDSLVRWAASEQSAADLRTLLRRRAEVVLRGAAAG